MVSKSFSQPSKGFSMLRLHPTLRKTVTRRPLAVVLLAAIFLTFSLSLPALPKKRCTPTSKEPYCPQPMQCVDSTNRRTPRPLVVVAAGGRRASSTFLYNALRILLRIRDPNTVSGWYVDLQNLYDSYAQVMPRGNGTVTRLSDGNRLEAFKSVGSLLVKIHTVRDWHDFLGGGDVEPVLENSVDAVYTSHRDLRDAVRSIRDMGWGVAYTQSQMADKDFCRRKRRKRQEVNFFRREDYASEDAWVTVARTEVRCHGALLESAGSTLKMDLKAEQLQGIEEKELLALLREIAHDLDYAYSNAELQLAAKELERLRPGACDNGFDVEMSLNPVTHLHKGHIRKGDEGDEKDERRGRMAIASDSICRRWMKQHLYIRD